MDGMCWWTASRLTAAMRAGELSSRELLDELVARVDRLDGQLNAVVARDIEVAAVAARAADEAQVSGAELGVLHGLPMTVKDTFETAGLTTTAGTEEFVDHVPGTDADAVARLVDAGAIVYAKTNVPPHGQNLQTHNELFGTTHNPWDPARTPGGSSGGAAVAVATGMSPLELGSDLAGSIRLPAAWNGVCGHKPTWGIVPLRGHVPGPPGTRAVPDINVAGPLARDVGDLEVALDVLAGPSPPHDRGWRLELPPGTADPATARAAVWVDDEACPTSRDVLDVLGAVVDALADAGMALVDARPEIDVAAHHRMGLRLVAGLTGAGLPSAAHDRLAAISADAGDDPGHFAEAAGWLTQTHAAWLRANERRARHLAAFERFFTAGDGGRPVDVLLTPVVCVPAIPHDHAGTFHTRTITVDGAVRLYTDLTFWTVLAGSVGLPATVVPVGLTADGLPVGLQIVGPYLGDRTTLAVARVVESLTGGFAAPPLASGVTV